MPPDPRARRLPPPRLHPAFLFALIFTVVFLLHAPLLRLPYFWDEAGYYVPAARDLLLTGDPIPRSTVSNAHPPLLMAWLALWWKLSGFKPAVTRISMLLVAAFGLFGVFRLARRAAGTSVAAATTLCTALYPVFFVQSSLAQADLPAAALGLWGLGLYLEERRRSALVMLALAALAKETAILVPLALTAWEVLWLVRRRSASRFAPPPRTLRQALALLLPAVPLALWYAYHWHRTGYVFGNPEYFRYNVEATLHPLRIALTLLRRLWQVTGYMNLFVLTVAAAAAMLLPPQVEKPSGDPRARIALPVQGVLGAVILAHLTALSLVGGAVLARYMLVTVPLVIVLCVSTLRRRVRGWPLAVGVVCLTFVAGLFLGPPYPYPPEDNLAYRDYILLHKRAADYLTAHGRHARVLTAWPASDELTKPWLGYVPQPIAVVRIDDFSAPQIALAAQARSQYDLALLFSTEYEPERDLLARFPAWERLQESLFDYHRDLPPDLAARFLGGQVILRARRGGEWITLVDMQHIESAASRPPR
ncbi:MAG TPA: glycosyltransferase family 39 protein [Terriglobales bacterium]|nr:glycosyltransferase family 39 protein [Terriglobales bacterium]